VHEASMRVLARRSFGGVKFAAIYVGEKGTVADSRVTAASGRNELCCTRWAVHDTAPI
jgi:hypothetical protein